jgi:multidrug resistance efflux pump
VKAAQQNYALRVANLAATVATNAKAQVDVERYRELLEQGVIAREKNDQFVMTGKVDAAGVTSDRAASAGVISAVAGRVAVLVIHKHEELMTAKTVCGVLGLG